MAPSSQPQSPEPICIHAPFQDGEHCLTQRHNSEWGPNGVPGPKRRLPINSHSKGSLEIPKASVKGPELPISDITIQPGLSPKSIHKDTETCGSRFEEEGNKTGHISRRHIGSGAGGRVPQEGHSRGDGVTVLTGIHYKPQEVSVQSNSIDRLSRVHNKHEDHVTSPLSREGTED